jgi:hypothetical protein
MNGWLAQLLRENNSPSPANPPYVPGHSGFYFAVFSTLPSLFAYGWCAEQVVLFVDAIRV